MDFNYTETQDMLRDTLARFLADTYDFETRKKMIASGEGRDPGIWRALATELGILSAPFSEEQGGLGGGAGRGGGQAAGHRTQPAAPNPPPHRFATLDTTACAF